MKYLRTICFLACVLTLGGSRFASAADTVYADNFLAAARQIVAYPVGQPTASIILGPQADAMVGMDFNPAASSLWAVNSATQFLGTLSTTNGAFTPVVGVQGGCCVTALTIDPVDGEFLVARGDNLVHSLDPATGETILLGVGAPAGSNITALAMSCGGVLVAAGDNMGQTTLYRADLQSAPVPIGTPNAGSATSLEFDNRTGVLYGWFNQSGADASRHGTVSLVNAQLSNESFVSGRYRMSIDNPCAADQLRVFRDGFEG